MAAAPFAALEARVNGAVQRALSNAIAVVDGVDVPVLFDAPYDAPFDGQADAATPACVGDTATLGGFQRGDSIVIDGVLYQVGSAEPDGSGMTRLALYIAGG
jgi:hypothetical protein